MRAITTLKTKVEPTSFKRQILNKSVGETPHRPAAKPGLVRRVKKFPKSSGVYLFVNKSGRVLYVGRATTLRHRVQSYFRGNDDRPHLQDMLRQTADIKYETTDTVLEAVILEANLIKKHWPLFNIQDGDDRWFVYIVINRSDYPRPLIVRSRDLQRFPHSAYVFGPYKSYRIARTALQLMRRIFPYSQCKPLTGKPCFEYQIGVCPGACLGAISKKDYQKNIRNLILMLRGQKKRLYQKLKKEDPERAAMLKHIQDVALITKEEDNFMPASLHRIEGYDISHLAGKETYGAMVVLKNGQPSNSDYRLFKIRTSRPADDLAALSEVIERRFRHHEWPFPDTVVIDGGAPQIRQVQKIFDELHLTIPLIGISKFSGDKLVFPTNTRKELKELAQSTKKTLLRVRDEAHRFAQSAHRRRRGKIRRNML